ncbi:aldo/keto reductase [Micromonospora sp. PPF5-17]|uniref:Aldo/keto reductase n=1 Tax=Micromonospora solifontis TaxID=2487138 RepID=A0ABX9WEX3_9ACTN|nr:MULTISPECIES: aldo/keto reductase [Micromonospora]NES37395.1 aldo/keto reductase [Micromonospora solifontis]NES58060.1 aldo/keto reductase [Micromonospora sp. PPF5-6]RNL98403.1 aldo/keto reductase [Micromonospora solifontis]
MTRSLGPSAVAVTALGFGAASIGNLYRSVPDDRAMATVDAAWAAGIRYFDTAPHYGLGLSERRLGRALAAHPRAEYVLSTKVGRLLRENPDGGSDLDNGFDTPATLRRVWDFTADGVRRSLDASLDRLGLDRVDVVLLHDPEESPEPEVALRQAYPALDELRRQGVVGAVGVGSKDPATLTRFAVETDVDVLMVAGRYTLLEQPALDGILPVCQKRGISVLNVGVFNSGLLAVEWPDENRPYEYGSAPAEILRRAQGIAAVCRRHGVSLPHAALAFAGAHPAVASVVVGAGRPAHVTRSAEWFARPAPPAGLWAELVAEGLLREDAPLPS